MNDDKIWANSGDSHLIEPSDLFDSLPEDIRERMPRSVRDEDGGFETVYIDGESFRRKLPKLENVMRNMARPAGDDSNPMKRAPGANDPHLRLKDSDEEGIWAEVIYPSLGIWAFNIRTPRVVKAGVEVLNDWAIDFQRVSPRYVCAASIPLLDV